MDLDDDEHINFVQISYSEDGIHYMMIRTNMN